MRRRVFSACMLFSLLLASCESASRGSSSASQYRFRPYEGTISPGEWNRSLEVEFSAEGATVRVPVQIYFPRQYVRGNAARTLIGLHSYAGSMSDWEKKTPVTEYAERFNFVVVCPQTQGTLFETKYYPETTMKWGPIPGGRWVGEVLIPYLRQSLNLATDRKKTGIFGHSWAARGAVLVASTYPQFFGAAAGLSGNYDMLANNRSKRFAMVYGDYNSFTERWNSDDNLIRLAENLKDIPLFLAHGEYDNDVHHDQTRMFAMRMIQLRNRAREKGPDSASYRFDLVLRKQEFHDWSFWRTATRSMMPFFNQYLER